MTYKVTIRSGNDGTSVRTVEVPGVEFDWQMSKMSNGTTRLVIEGVLIGEFKCDNLLEGRLLELLRQVSAIYDRDDTFTLDLSVPKQKDIPDEIKGKAHCTNSSARYKKNSDAASECLAQVRVPTPVFPNIFTSAPLGDMPPCISLVYVKGNALYAGNLLIGEATTMRAFYKLLREGVGDNVHHHQLLDMFEQPHRRKLNDVMYNCIVLGHIRLVHDFVHTS